MEVLELDVEPNAANYEPQLNVIIRTGSKEENVRRTVLFREAESAVMIDDLAEALPRIRLNPHL